MKRKRRNGKRRKPLTFKAWLQARGYRSYAKYLTSKAWARLRAKVLRRDEWRCVTCGEQATQVHHRSYDIRTMDGGRLDALVSLCHACHEWVEWDGNRKTRTDEKEERLTDRQAMMAPMWRAVG